MLAETLRNLKSGELAALFAALADATKVTPPTQNFAERLVQFFEELPTIPSDQAVSNPPSPAHTDLLHLFDAVRFPLEAVKLIGGRLNIWTIAGLKYNEVRTAGALAGLWRTEFGGGVSRDFLAFYLGRIDRGVDWHWELCNGYSVFTEVNPLGDLSDRVDLVIETTRYLIGIEIKIKAGLGYLQLERYASALEARARHARKFPLLILLAPFSVATSDVRLSSWGDVSAAAKQAMACKVDVKSLAHHVIAQFGDHVAQH